jgi:hypothetical protein
VCEYISWLEVNGKREEEARLGSAHGFSRWSLIKLGLPARLGRVICINGVKEHERMQISLTCSPLEVGIVNRPGQGAWSCWCFGRMLSSTKPSAWEKKATSSA